MRWCESIRVSPCQPGLALQGTPAVDIQNGIAMVKEKRTPDFRPTIPILLYQGSVAFEPAAYVPEQYDAANDWTCSETFVPGPNVDPCDWRGQ